MRQLLASTAIFISSALGGSAQEIMTDEEGHQFYHHETDLVNLDVDCVERNVRGFLGNEYLVDVSRSSRKSESSNETKTLYSFEIYAEANNRTETTDYSEITIVLERAFEAALTMNAAAIIIEEENLFASIDYVTDKQYVEGSESDEGRQRVLELQDVVRQPCELLTG